MSSFVIPFYYCYGVTKAKSSVPTVPVPEHWFTDVLQYSGVQRSGGQLRGDGPGDLQWPVLCPGDWSLTGPSLYLKPPYCN
jgi:hypothetical protein